MYLGAPLLPEPTTTLLQNIKTTILAHVIKIEDKNVYSDLLLLLDTPGNQPQVWNSTMSSIIQFVLQVYVW